MDAVYLFCLAGAAPPGDLGEGLESGRPVFIHPFRATVAIVCQVERDAFCGSGAETRLQDLNWIAPRAQRHMEVLRQVMASEVVLPVTFGTLFSSWLALDHSLCQHEAAIAAGLRRLQGREEWSVAATIAQDSGCRALRQEVSGRGYLQMRRQEEHARDERRRDLDRAHAECAAALEAFGTVGERPISGLAPTRGFELAVLVDPAALGGLRLAVAGVCRRYSEAGIQLEVRGPWPPFTFATVGM